MTKKEKQILQDGLKENYMAFYYYQFCCIEDWTREAAERVASLKGLMYELGLHDQITDADKQAFESAKYAFEHRNR